MPIYEYKCANCGKFEVMQKITEDSLTECPTCGGQVQRLISKNVSIVFKGSGFYTTDHTQKENRARAINEERQRDNQAILDGDIKGYVEQSESTDRKVSSM